MPQATWVETEARALLARSPPEELAPPDTAGFTLVLLALEDQEWPRLTQAVERVCGQSAEDAAGHLARPLPVALRTGLTHVDALLGQFELICCDAVSVFLVDDVVICAPTRYLAELYPRLLRSDEFEVMHVRIESLPGGPESQALVDRFFGRSEIQTPLETKMMRKKARIMAHLAAKIGGRVVLA